MGDRAQIEIRENGKSLFLYTHWQGFKLPPMLQSALVKGEDRWRDPPYLARVIFQTMIGKDDGITGYGLSPCWQDTE